MRVSLPPWHQYGGRGCFTPATANGIGDHDCGPEGRDVPSEQGYPGRSGISVSSHDLLETISAPTPCTDPRRMRPTRARHAQLSITTSDQINDLLVFTAIRKAVDRGPSLSALFDQLRSCWAARWTHLEHPVCKDVATLCNAGNAGRIASSLDDPTIYSRLVFAAAGPRKLLIMPANSCAYWNKNP